ncbi:MAG: SAM-dependent methyltransferase [Polyangiaceae bacterium]
MMPTPKSYFEEKYAENDDPWGFRSRAYEKRKYTLTIASLPRSHYQRAFEPGCSIGVLTKLLAKVSGELIAYEMIPRAACSARAGTAKLGHVHVEEKSIPDQWPQGELDLIVLSEIVYYLDEDRVGRLIGRIDDSLAPNGHVVAVHYRGVTDYPLTGDRAHELLATSSCLRRVARYEEELFHVDVFERADL